MNKKSKKIKLEYKTIFISDTHLGMSDCRIKELNYFLSNVKCRKLVLNGDIIDGWYLKRKGCWSLGYTRFIRLILKMVEKNKTRVIYLRGNHDDFLSGVLPIAFDKVKICERYIHKGIDRRYLVVHGDCFDSFSTNKKWIAKIGAIGYDNLLKLNRIYNKFRKLRGKDYFSLSRWAKARVKSAVNYTNRYEEPLSIMAKRQDCQGMICGHIHIAADRMVHGIRYLNSGDWVESMTGIVERKNGEIEVFDYEQFKKELKSLRSRRGTGIKAVADYKVPLTAEISDSATPLVAKKRISSKLVF